MNEDKDTSASAKVILIALPVTVKCPHCKEENDLRSADLGSLMVSLPCCEHCDEVIIFEVSEVRRYQ